MNFPMPFKFPVQIIFSFLVMLLSVKMIAQKEAKPLKPTLTEALVVVSMKNKKQEPKTNAHIFFEGRLSGKKYEVVTDTLGKAEILLPIIEEYNVFYNNEEKIKEYDILELAKRKFQSYELVLIYEPAYKVIIENVLFETNKDIISVESYPELNELVDLMRENISIEIEISGHTDSIGSEAYNLRLSQRRADADKTFVEKNGIEPDRVTAIGYGETRPVVLNDTEEGRARNRRTEVKAIN
jgi:outer membrane protein OmpA-like peptidoglycan-associated protein